MNRRTSGGKLSGFAKTLNKAGKKVGNKLLKDAKKEAEKRGKKALKDFAKPAIRNIVDGGFDSIGTVANSYVPGSNFVIDELQNRANRALDKKLDKTIDGLGFSFVKKGSQAAKDKMAKLRAMKGSKSGGSFKTNTGGSFRAPGEKRGGSLENSKDILAVTSPFPQIQNTKLFRNQLVSGSGFLV